jgi:8-oxo-dGTP pyrophosphatase MutT (NUDIX family)
VSPAELGELPDWWQPLAGRALAARRSDFTRWPTPPVGGRSAAVLILLGEDPNTGPDVLILQRSATMRSHAGQPAFPGGGADPDDADATATAMREATEEVGLDPASTTVVAALPRLWIPVSGYVVTPVLAWWHRPHPVAPVDLVEVARVERLPVRELVDPANRLRVRHPSGYVGPAFAVRDMLVWGFTAGVLNTLLDLAGWAVPWDHDRVHDLPTSL